MSTLLEILKYPHPVLSLTAKPINTITPEIRKLAKDMLYTMEHNNGIGLAANQVGVLHQLIVINIDEEDLNGQNVKMPLVLINPTIVYASKDTLPFEEGCLSFPHLRVTTNRSATVTVEYLDLEGKKQSISASDLLAVCLQHEIDHLNGFVFVNRVSSLKKDLLLRKYMKLQNVKKS